MRWTAIPSRPLVDQGEQFGLELDIRRRAQANIRSQLVRLLGGYGVDVVLIKVPHALPNEMRTATFWGQSKRKSAFLT